MSKIPGYVNGGEGPSEPDDDGQDMIGNNPTGRKRRSSAGQRRKRDRRLFGGTKWGKDKDK